MVQTPLLDHFGLIAPSIAEAGENAPGSHGFKGWTYPLIFGAGSGLVLTTGLQYFMKIWVPRDVTVSNILIDTSAAAVTPTAGANNLALYDAAGNRLAATVDQTTNYTGAAGPKTIALSASVDLEGGPDKFVWGAIKSTGATPVGLIRQSLPAAAMANLGLTAALSLAATNGTVTNALLPATITPSSHTQLSSLLWMALS